MKATLTAFFLREIDFIFLIYGLAFLFLGAVSLIVARRHRELPWSFLSAFGFSHGINEWLDWMALIWPNSIPFNWVRLVCLGVSLLMLAEFGRRALTRLNGRPFSSVLPFGFIALAAAGIPYGLDGLNVSFRLSGGFLGALLAAIAILQFAQRIEPRMRNGLRLAGISLLFYAVATGLITPLAPFWPDWPLNAPAILTRIGIPIQVFRMVAASLIALGLTFFSFGSLFPEPHPQPRGWRNLRHYAPYWLTAGTLVITLSAGWIATQNYSRRADRQLRTQLLDDTVHLANTLDPQLVAQLRYVSTDVNLPAYRRIRDQLTVWGPWVPKVRWIYLVTRRQQTLVFGPDNVPTDDPNHSPPGDLYADAPPELHRVFETSEPVVVGPYRDVWGSFISAFVPIREPRSNAILSVIGLDILTDRWDLDIHRARLPPLLMTAVMALLIVLAFGIFLHRALIPEKNTPLFLEYAESFFSIAIGLFITALAGVQSYHVTLLAQTDKFREWTTVQTKEFQDELRRLGRDARTIAHFYEGSEWVTLAEFDTFTAPLINDNRALQAYGWVPLLSARDRAAFEARVRAEGLPHFVVHGDARPASDSPKSMSSPIFPVERLAPREENSALWGLDLASNRHLSDCITWSLDCGLETASDSFDMTFANPARKGFMLAFPTRLPHAPGPDWANGWSGFVVSFVRINSLLELSRAGFAAPHFPIQAHLIDLTPGSQPTLLADSAHRAGIPLTPESFHALLRERSSPWRHVIPIFIAGRTWALSVKPDPVFFNSGILQIPWLLILVGGLVTLLLGAFIFFLQTARNRAEKLVAVRTRELRTSETNFRNIAERAPFAVMISNFDGHVSYVNSAVYDIFEVPPEEDRNQTVHVNRFYRSPADRQRLLDALRNTGRAHLEIELNTWLGRPIWTLISAAIIPYNNEQAICVACVDITNRKQAETELHRQTQLLRTLLDGIPDIVALQNPDHTVLFYNRAGYAFLQNKPSEIDGKKCFELIGQDQPCDECATARALQTGRMEIIEKYMPHFDAWMEVRAIPVFDDEGKIRLVIEVLRDITATKTAALRQIEANRKLESVNRQLHEAIEQARKMADIADAANRSKSRFLANVSHEIRTPLNGIIGMTDLLAETPLSEPQKGFIDILRRNNEHLLLMLNDLLDSAKIEAGRIELEDSVFDLPQLIAHLIEGLALTAQDKDLELYYQIAPDVPTLINGDPARLRQVLLNLLSNAVKFTSHGTVSLAVSIDSPADGTGSTLRFETRDTGPGIPTHLRDSIFKPFIQGDASTTRRFGGTGLGLSIARHLVQLMGGQLDYESQEGQGTCFHFNLPLKPAAAPTAAPVPTPAGLRLLVGESHPEIRAWLTDRLRAWGHQVTLCPDGEAVWKVLDSGDPEYLPFDRLILDSRLCRAQGQPLLDALLQDARFRHLPLMLTCPIRDQAKFRSTGIADVLSRPINPTLLAENLQHLNATKQPSRTDPPVPPPTPPAFPDWNGSVRVLVAEDHPVNLNIAVRLLAKLGCQSDEAHDGKQAVAALERENYDLVLMDIQMPEMDGLETTRIIRDPTSRVLNHATPVIAMSAYALSEDRDQLLESGINDILAKPVGFANLIRLLKTWLPPPASPKPNGPTPLPSASPRWNAAAFLHRCDGDGLLAHSIIKTFLDQIAFRNKILRKAVDLNDFTLLHRQIFTLRASIVALELGPLCPGFEALENAVAGQDAAAIKAELKAFESTLDVVREEFEDLLRAPHKP